MSYTQIDRVEHHELTCWRVRVGSNELLLAEQGAQVLSYQQAGQPLIWLSEQARLAKGKSVRGGAPICWPWFGDLKRNPSALQAQHQDLANAPFHGAVRSETWQLDNIEDQNDQVLLQFSFDTREQPITAWPHAMRVEFEVRVDQRLRLSLTNHNLGQTPLAISQALHTYFAVSDIRQVAVQGLNGCRYIETLEDWQQRQQQGSLNFAGETDRIYLDVPAKLRLEDAGWQRAICLEASGSSSAVLWNPWINKSLSLSDFAEDAWQRMLCIETANIWDDCLTLAPNQTHQLSLSLWSEAL